MDNSLSPGVYQAGDVEFKRLDLIDTKDRNTRYNLLGSFVDMTIYEDIFSPVLTGYVALIESQNLIASIPIVGEEMLHVEFTTPSLRTISCLFTVSKIGVREHGDKKNAYTMELISYEGYVDINQRFSQSFSGNPTELIQQFYKKTFNQELLEADRSDNTIKFVSPYWGPLKVMNHAASRALYPNNKMITPNYLFYQSNRGHKLKSLSNLLSQTPFTDYFFDKNPARLQDTNGTSVRDIDREYKSIKELYFVSSQDYVKNMVNGAYNHRVYGVNLFRKKFDVKTYSYQDNFAKSAHVDGYKLKPLPISNVSGMHSIKHTYPNAFDGVADLSDEIVAKRLSLLAQLETYKIDIVVHGRTDMEVGKCVNVWLNEFKTADQSDKYKETYDPVYSGKYLVTAIQHRFTQAKHQMNMQLVKDSAFTEIMVK